MGTRESFGSKIGIIATAAGAAIGLGNIWKFPYMTGRNGGGAFILIYLLAVLLMGFPLIYAELALGRNIKKNAVATFATIGKNKRWALPGGIGVLAIFLVATFYMMITGWVIYYFVQLISGNLYDIAPGVEAATHFSAIFSEMESSFVSPFIYAVIAVLITGLINSLGIEKGVEKYSKILMPMLFAIFVILIGYSTTLPGFTAATEFLFKPDFSLITPTVAISAIGQAFFSLNVGYGVLITYGSYVPDNLNLRQIALQIAVADTIIALFAGLLIFPAVFTYNLPPTAGPSLIFQSLPQVFLQMPGGRIFSILFFLLTTIAAITSMLSMLEPIITYLVEKTRFSRKVSALITFFAISAGGLVVIAGEGPLSYIQIFGKSIFDTIDYLTSNIMIPVCGVMTAVLATWVWKTSSLNLELEKGGKPSGTVGNFFNFMLKWVVPPAITLLMISLLLGSA